MPEFPFVSGGVIRTVGSTSGASSVSTTLTAGGAANTKGSAVELIASTEFDANWVLITFTDLTSGVVNFLVDILIGAATEQVIIPDLYATARGNGGAFGPYLFPVFIPAGSRIAARCQCNEASWQFNVAVTLIAGTALSGGSGPSYVSAYGATTTSEGTNIDPGAVANTDSSWVEIAASTDRTHHWLVIAARFGDWVLAAKVHWRLSIGIGAATETVLVPDIHVSSDTITDGMPASVYCLPVFIPKGSRLTAKVRSSVTTDADRDIWLKLYGC